MQPSIVQAQPIILDGGTTPGCLPPARGAARERINHTAPEATAVARGLRVRCGCARGWAPWGLASCTFSTAVFP